MKKNVAVAIAKLYNNLYANSTEDTRTFALVREPYLKRNKANMWEVEVLPTASNDGTAFYATEECTDIKRAFKVSFIVSQEDGKLVGRFF